MKKIIFLVMTAILYIYNSTNTIAQNTTQLSLSEVCKSDRGTVDLVRSTITGDLVLNDKSIIKGGNRMYIQHQSKIKYFQKDESTAKYTVYDCKTKKAKQDGEFIKDKNGLWFNYKTYESISKQNACTRPDNTVIESELEYSYYFTYQDYGKKFLDQKRSELKLETNTFTILMTHYKTKQNEYNYIYALNSSVIKKNNKLYYYITIPKPIKNKNSKYWEIEDQLYTYDCKTKRSVFLHNLRISDRKRKKIGGNPEKLDGLLYYKDGLSIIRTRPGGIYICNKNNKCKQLDISGYIGYTKAKQQVSKILELEDEYMKDFKFVDLGYEMHFFKLVKNELQFKIAKMGNRKILGYLYIDPIKKTVRLEKVNK